MKKISFKNTIKIVFLFTITSIILIGTLIGENSVNAFVDDKGASYSVHKLTYNSSTKKISYGPSLLTTTNFNSANVKMKELSKKEPNYVVKSTKSLSPEKIVAADRGYVQTYPYRKGSISGHGVTMNYYRDKSLSNGRTYVASHYLMQLYGTEIYNNRMIFNVELSGKNGYMEADKGDIIPMLYVDKQVPFTMGGNETYYGSNPEKPYSMVVSPVEYRVKKDSNGNRELSLHYRRTHPSIGHSALRYALAPDWLPEGTYYSADGIKFYKDLDLKQEVSKGKEFYAYYQWLPIKSRSNYDGDDFNKVMTINGKTSTAITDKEQSFRDAGDKYGINPLLLFAQAIHESGWATSYLATEHNNLFGWDAVDSNPSNAKKFESVYDSIKDQAGVFLRNYTRPGYDFHYGPSFGNKDSGITVMYASDPYYGEKVAGHAYSADKLLGFKDYNAYELSMTPDRTKTPVYKDSTGKTTWYYTEGSPLTKQMILNLGKTGSYTKTNLYTSILNGKAVLDYGINYVESDLTKEFGYINSSSLRQVDSSSQRKGKIDSTRVSTSNTQRTYYLTTNTALKSVWNASSRNLLTIPKGTKVNAWDATNGWVRVYYKGLYGYVPKANVSDKDLGTPVEDKTAHYIVLPDNIAYLNVRKEASTNSEIVSKRNHGDKVMAVKFNSSWYEIDLGNNSVGYVHADYVSKTKPNEPDKPTEPDKYLKGDVNGDGVIDGFDMMAVKRHYLGSKKLTGDSLKAADVNGDGVVDGFDMMAIKRHYLGTKPIKQ